MVKNISEELLNRINIMMYVMDNAHHLRDTKVISLIEMIIGRDTI